MTKTTAERLTTLETEILHLQTSGDERREAMIQAVSIMEKKLDEIQKSNGLVATKLAQLDTKVTEKFAANDEIKKFFPSWQFWAIVIILCVFAGIGITLSSLIGLDVTDRLAKLQSLTK